MKRNYILTAICLLFMTKASALTVTVEGHGEIDENGLELYLDQAEPDPLTDERQMDVKGTLLCSGPLTVTIERSSEGTKDEFCCAGRCTPGNGQRTETLEFTPEGVVTWFSHFMPAPGTHTIESHKFTFSSGNESCLLTVNYEFNSEGVEKITVQKTQSTKILRDGQVVIMQGDKQYTIQGTEIKQ